MSTAVSTHTGAGPLSLMSCVRESSPPQDVEIDYENEKNVGGPKKKRFWNKWFGKRKNKVSDDTSPPNDVIEMPKESQRSRSTSELSETEEPTRRRNGTPMHPGLSVSHDSVFHSPHSGSEIELEGAQSSSSLSIHHHTDRLQTELTERLRLRRGRGDTSEDDEGLPRSPCNSPTATDKTAIKDNPKSHSTCSEASLLSVGSSEMDEDSFGQHSTHSSKLSLDDRNTADGDFDLDLSLKNTSAPLNHSGARHKASVKPQRRYGAPRKKRLSASVLPTTPEVNEETAIRSITPEVSSAKEIVTELYTSSAISSHKSMNKTSRTLTENQLKCSSLPPGLAAPGSDTNKLNRSRSNAGTKYQDEFSTLGEEDEGKENKKTDSFLGRIFPRRSGKKKKSKEEKTVSTSSSALSSSSNIITTNTVTSKQIENVEFSIKELSHSEKRVEILVAKPIPVPRSGPAARQRIQPNDIPASPELTNRFEDTVFKSSPDKNHPSSPLHIELENRLQQRLGSLSTSPKAPMIRTPPLSPKLQRSPLVSPPKSPLSYPKVPLKSHLIEKMNSKHSRSEEIRSKVIITGLSAFQQRAVNNNNNNMDEDDSDGFKSLNDLPTETTKPSKLVGKSHSFKVTNSNNSPTESKTTFASLTSRSTHEIQNSTKTSVVNQTTEFNTEIKKTVSLDSIKNLDSINGNAIEIFEDVKVRQFEESKEQAGKISRSNSKELRTLEPVVKEETKEFANKIISSESKKIIDKNLAESKETSSKIAHVESKEFIAAVSSLDTKEFISNGITISGPRHKAIVSVTNHESSTSEISSKTETSEVKQSETHKEIKEQQISVTKIQVKQESTQVSISKSTIIPEFMNIQLHKVEKPANNVILTTGFPSPKSEERSKTNILEPDLVAVSNLPLNAKSSMEAEKPLETEPQTGETVRKFSKEEIEIIERNELDDEKKHVATALVTITTMTPPVPTRMFKKNDFQIRKSLISVNNTDKPILKTKSTSLDMTEAIKDSEDMKSEEKVEIIAKTQSVNDLNETINTEPNVPLRRKSMVKQKQDDEPELMKVFARRSLKLKDNESELLSQQVIKMAEESNMADVKSRDSDKENQLDSPSEERKIISTQKETPKLKEPLLETKFVEGTTDVTFRKPVNNNKLYNYQRTVSLNNAKTNEFNNYEKIQKQNSFGDRPKTDHWINFKPADSETCNKISQEEILTSIAEKTLIEDEFCTKPKNFNQRKAEWEKRAQEASRKTTP